MGLLFRGIFYFGLYLLIALLPLGAALFANSIGYARPYWVEVAVAAGFLSFSIMLLEFALVSRLRVASDPFGTDALVYFHRVLGITATLMLVAHIVLLMGRSADWGMLNPFSGSYGSVTGAIALWLLLVLIVSSLLRKRLRISYTLWDNLHRWTAFFVVIASLMHIQAFGSYTESALVRWTVAGLTVFFLGLLVTYGFVRPFRLWRRPWQVVANEDAGADTRSLTVAPVGHPGFRFEPGQFAWLITGRTPFVREQHPITIAGSAEPPADGAQQYGIKNLGDWSGSMVKALKPGDRLWVEGPYGALSIDREPAQGFVLIGGGIGITPMRSILLTLRDRGDNRPCLLFYAAANWDGVVYKDELLALESSMNLEIVWVFERPDAGFSGEHGRMSRDILERHLPKHFAYYQFFICGPNPMMDAVERLLAEYGVPEGRIHSERFDNV